MWMLFFLINAVAYILMWIDKLKSLRGWWRISEKTLWYLAIIGGVFGIWLGMQWPLYHKAGKNSFRLSIPIIALVWTIVLVYVAIV